MTFCIEPAQTMWSFSDQERNSAHCWIKVPKDSTVIGIVNNHVLIKHGFFKPGAMEQKNLGEYTNIAMLGIRVGAILEDNVWNEDGTFLGCIQLGEQLATYAIFVCRPEQTFVNTIVCKIRDDINPERIARIFHDEIARVTSKAP